MLKQSTPHLLSVRVLSLSVAMHVNSTNPCRQGASCFSNIYCISFLHSMAGIINHECLQGEVFGVEMPFIIQAKDTCNNKRSSGGDLFTVSTLSSDVLPSACKRAKSPSRRACCSSLYCPKEASVALLPMQKPERNSIKWMQMSCQHPCTRNSVICGVQLICTTSMHGAGACCGS